MPYFVAGKPYDTLAGAQAAQAAVDSVKEAEDDRLRSERDREYAEIVKWREDREARIRAHDEATREVLIREDRHTLPLKDHYEMQLASWSYEIFEHPVSKSLRLEVHIRTYNRRWDEYERWGATFYAYKGENQFSSGGLIGGSSIVPQCLVSVAQTAHDAIGLG